jgi:hypothetical protein
MEVNALVAAGAAALAKGAVVKLAADGTVVAQGGTGKVIGTVNVAVDNSAGGTPARCIIKTV